MQTTTVDSVTELLDNPVRTYAWGSLTAIPDLLGVPPSGKPQAELWMGAHPAGPSSIRRGGQPASLLACIDSDPQGELGADVVSAFGPRLPFLFKVIAAAAPLSLQAHPSARQAQEGYAEETARGIPLDAPERNYRDPNPKPELLCALTPFTALCGFRPVADTLRLLQVVAERAETAERRSPVAKAAELISPYLAALRARPGRDGLREVVTGLLTLPNGRRQRLVHSVAAACRHCLAGQDSSAGHGRGHPGSAVRAAEGGNRPISIIPELATVVELAERYPADVGVVISLLLNLVHLQPGQTMFLPPGNLHAHLRGVGLEIMANSDNVLRGGLTPKHVDVPELLRVVDISDLPISVGEPERVGVEDVFAAPVQEFRLSRVQVVQGSAATLPPAGPQILFVVAGEAAVTTGAGGPALPLARGHSAWVRAGAPVTLTGPATVFRATTNVH